MITIAKEIEKEKGLTIEDIDYGETFVILTPDWNGVYLMCDNDTFVDITTGETYDANYNNYLTVRKIDLTLVER